MLLEQFLTKWVKPAGKFRSLELCLSVLLEQFLTRQVKPAGKFHFLELCLSPEHVQSKLVQDILLSLWWMGNTDLSTLKYRLEHT